MSCTLQYNYDISALNNTVVCKQMVCVVVNGPYCEGISHCF